MLPRRIVEILRGLRLVLRYMRVQILSLLDIQARIARLRDQRDNQDGQPRAPRRARRRFWMKPWLLGREEYGHYDALMPEMERDDLQSYRNFLRVHPDFFQELEARIGPRIQKKTTFYRRPLSAGLKLAITMRHLATGETYTSLQYSFRVGRSTITKLIPEVCEAIVEEYQDEAVVCPTDLDDWKKKEAVFRTKWNVPHALGALDGKHIAIRRPRGGGSEFFNYKGFHSIVMLALVDAEYRFLWVDLGSSGSWSDAQIFNQSVLREKIEDESIGFPPPQPLTPDAPPVAYFILGDDAFALKTWLMKPFSRRGMDLNERLYNYRISRGRRVVENVFGILVQRFRVLLSTMQQEPRVVATITIACVILHNLMRERYGNLAPEEADPQDDPTLPPQDALIGDQNPQEARNPSRAAKQQRDILMDYFINDGAVPWQMDRI